MVISFPHLGNTAIAGRALFEELRIKCITPEAVSRKTLEIGSKYSPEDICLPYKLMVGNYIDAINKGADTIIITGSCGPCRYGEYCELQRNVLRKIKNDVNLIVIDSPGDIGKEELLNRIKYISSNSPLSKEKKIAAFVKGIRIINNIDKLEKMLRIKAGYEIETGECKRLLQSCKKELMDTEGIDGKLSMLKEYYRRALKVKVDKTRNPVKIAVIGEIYTIIEPYSNLFLEDKLMDLGVSTYKMLYPSWWVKNTFLKAVKLDSLKIKKYSKEYMPYYIGGHGKECIGEAVIASTKGLDGAIQVFPFGCMPEIVSKSVLPNISKDRNFPIMSLIVDELTGEAGYITRIEAFVDLLERRKRRCII
ncbi:acyl-CoA dehydratase activase-related protein [Clostridium oryzae]|uniref:DUF2229 domain-containing protein n=1 Tax=Clostridium oryzae TaxID=1450648 RepID=A0A1V4IIQ7_9CLOT|nr:acyl-CoA dehydratase activase-related protein [Clostridium oryzae]OPJ59585.1 hypothetical protein CLORY_32320 [Clostridium oryzae]